MNDYRNLKILGVLGLTDDHHLELAGAERQKAEDQKLRGKLRHLEVSIAGDDYQLILMRAPEAIGSEFSHKGKAAELFYVGLKQKKVKKVKRKTDEDNER